jgi:hypothetical protein
VAVLSLAACGHGHPAARAVPTTVTTSTTVAPTTTTTRPKPRTPPPPPTSPLTGLYQPNSHQLSAPAVVVKIDNVDEARPQTGINQADVVYEEEVEGGLTRLAAVFQSKYPAVVGPVRSGRLTDEGIADDLNHPVLAYSGTNAIFLPILRSQPVTDVDGENYPGLFYRSGANVAPHNLYSDVAWLAAASATHRPPLPLFGFVPAGGQFSGPGLAPAAGVALSFPAASVRWDYSPKYRLWVRTQNGSADVDQSGTRLSADNVIVQFVPYVSSGEATGEGGPPASIPEGELVGSGPAWYLSGGRVLGGSWTRSALTTLTVFKDGHGHSVRLNRGRTWIELVPLGAPSTLIP